MLCLLLDGITQFDYSWYNLASGWIPGSIGETNKFIILVAAIVLMGMKLISWRVILGGVSGLFAMSYIGMLLAPYSDNSMLSIPPHYHLVMGSFAFGLTFMATEPVTGSHTDAGRLFYGFFVGCSHCDNQIYKPSISRRCDASNIIDECICFVD